MSEPRSRTAEEVADHASTLLDDIQRASHVHGTAVNSQTPTQRDLERALDLVSRLAAQVEDLAAVVAGGTEVTSIEVLEPEALDWHGHLLAARQHLRAVILDGSNPEDIVEVTHTPLAAIERIFQAIEDGEV